MVIEGYAAILRSKFKNFLFKDIIEIIIIGEKINIHSIKQFISTQIDKIIMK